MYLNIQSLISNFNELEATIVSRDFDIILLTETHVTDMISDNEVELKNYYGIRCNSASRHTGGVSIYIKKMWQYKILWNYALDMDLWWIVLRVYCKNYSFILANVYKSPRASNIIFCEKISELMENMSEYGCDVILAGDFNINWYDESNIRRREISNIIASNGCQQIVSQPTRITNNTRTLIDYVITNTRYVRVDVDSTLGITDHETLVIKLKLNNNIKDNNIKKFKTLNYNRDSFAEALEISSFSRLIEINDLHDMSNEFKDVIIDIANKFIIERQSLSESNPWYSNYLKEFKKKKEHKRRKAVLTNNQQHWAEYKIERNRYKKELNSTKDKYIRRKLANCSDQKTMWRTIKLLVLRESRNDIKNVFFNGVLISDDETLAREFNRYFIGSVQQINESIATVPYVNYIESMSINFVFKEVSFADLKDALKGISQKRDSNMISPQMILESFNVIGPVMLNIINQSLAEGRFPDSWKCSIVTPIEKTRGTNKCEEFRPINSLPLYEKVFEKIVHTQLEEHLENNEIIIENQSGFRKGHSCEAALNMVLTSWKETMSRRKSILCVFLDLKRAFETIDRAILLEKLSKYGVNGVEKDWFTSYLTGRTQITNVNGKLSIAERVTLGVPQGSILGPMLFNIYINDMGKVIRNSRLALFADDALLFVEADSALECENQMMEDLSELNQWLKANKLKLNVSKTKCMLLNEDRAINLTIDNEIVQQVKEMKYLGVVIDQKLKFESHVNYIAKKIAKKVGFFRRIRNRVAIISAINIYNVLIKPHFEYCSTILFMMNQSSASLLQKLQNKAMRIILRCNVLTPIRNMLSTLLWLSIKQRLMMNVLIFIFKIKNNMLPNYLFKYISYVRDIQPYSLRNRNDFRLINFKNNSSQNSLVYNGFKLFNELPSSVKDITNLNEFKRAICAYVRSKFF